MVAPSGTTDRSKAIKARRANLALVFPVNMLVPIPLLLSPALVSYSVLSLLVPITIDWAELEGTARRYWRRRHGSRRRRSGRHKVGRPRSRQRRLSIGHGDCRRHEGIYGAEESEFSCLPECELGGLPFVQRAAISVVGLISRYV